MIIRTPDQRVRVFVSSTLAELADERRAVARAISAMRLTPVMFETGARPHPPRDVYQAYLAQSDVFIGVYWQRYGWVGTGMEISGLEEELQLSRGLPRLLYVKSPAPAREPRLADLLAGMQAEAADSYRHFRTPDELGRLVRDDLAALLSDRFGSGSARATPQSGRAPGPRPMPVSTTLLIGRERTIEEVADLFAQSDVRLVTLTGPGGIGKTRLALAVGEQLGRRFDAGVAFVPLAAVNTPEQVLTSVGRALGANVSGIDSPLEALIEEFGDARWLLILDNLEQVVNVARDLAELLARCAGLAILATSRTALALRAEHEYRVPPLALPGEAAGQAVEELAASPAVALFVDRARAVRQDFALTSDNVRSVVEICRRLDGLPLAIELAAARTRLLDPDALLLRLTTSLDALGTGTVDSPDRQHTLRATVEWSVGLLDEDERSLLEILAAFVDGWNIEAAAEVAGLDEDEALGLVEALARHSLVHIEHTALGSRSRMLETVRAFLGERLAARPDVDDIRRRHAEHYRALAEEADRPLRGVGHAERIEQLRAEAGNLGAAVEWLLAHDTAPLPHLFRTLWPFLFMGDYMDEARAWVDRLLPSANFLDSEPRAELMWTSAVIALEVGDDATAMEAGERLGPLVVEIHDPVLHAVCHLAVAWTSPIVGDHDRALREALIALEELRHQDEPFWTALALGTAGLLETAMGRHDAALGHLSEARRLGDGFPWLSAWSEVILATVAVVQGRLDEARALLDEALQLSVATRSTPITAMCLFVFARAAIAEGDAHIAAELVGIADGLRRRLGYRAWPALRRGEDELVAQLRESLGPDRFGERCAAGARVSLREAVTAVRILLGDRMTSEAA